MMLNAVRLLLDHPNIDVSATDRWGRTALMWASAFGHLDCIRFLIEKGGADVNAKSSREGDTALILATTANRLDVVQLLQDSGADVDDNNGKGLTALMVAAYYGIQDIAETILKRNATVNQRISGRTGRFISLPGGGKTALVLASGRANLGTLKVLIDHGAEVDAKDDGGNTALMAAVTNGNLDVVKALLESNADPNVRNNQGKTALMLATGQGLTRVASLLLDHEAQRDEVGMILSTRQLKS